jgi:hypothetical protein
MIFLIWGFAFEQFVFLKGNATGVDWWISWHSPVIAFLAVTVDGQVHHQFSVRSPHFPG